MNTLIKSLSVIIPAYNCEKYISRTLESIITSLDYFYANYPLADQVKSEIIVANDCSTDNTTFFVSQFIGKKYPVKLVNHSINQGAGPARNTGFKNSQGEILFFCDGDDLFLPVHIYVCFMLLQGQYDAKTTFLLVQDNYQAQVNFLEQPVDAIKTKVKIEEDIHPGWQQGIENSLPLNLCVRRNCHEFLEGFPEEPIYKQIGGEDSAYYRYLREFFKIAYVNLVTVQFIRYPGNSLDQQMPKFQLAPGQYQGPLPGERLDLRAEAMLMEKARIDILQKKYQQYSLGSSKQVQNKNIPSTITPVWKTEYEEFCQTKKFQYTQDWFSHNIPIWSQVLQRLINKPNINFLEVGSWEGRSTCWLLDQILTHPSAKITCVDTFVGSVEHQNYESGYLQSLEERFDFNISQIKASEKVEKRRGSSQEVLRSLPLDHYDFYYVDGSHLAPDVLEDIILGWRLVKVNGIIIFDDYNLKLSEKATENVKLAVDAFYAVFQEKIKILHQGYQVIVEKIIA